MAPDKKSTFMSTLALLPVSSVCFQHFPPFHARRRREGSCRWAWAGTQLGSAPRGCVPWGDTRMWGPCKQGRCSWDTNPTWPHCCCLSSEVPTTALLHFFKDEGSKGSTLPYFHWEPHLEAPSSNFLILGPGIPPAHIPSCFSLQDTLCL